MTRRIMSSFPHYLEFHNGQKMPIIGLGTWLVSEKGEVEENVNNALEFGYRHIDTAYVYKNEEGVGRALKKWFDAGKLKREDVFITTKLPGTGMRSDLVKRFLTLSLKKLQLDYVDLYLIHSPVGMKYIDDDTLYPMDEKNNCLWDKDTNLVEIWKAMEAQVDEGLAKSIGVSNFNSKQVERISKAARIPVANNQVELNVYFQQKKLREMCTKYKVTVCAYAPLGSRGRYKEGSKFVDVLKDTVVNEIASKHKKTSAQVLLRYLIQQNIVVIPKSSNASRIKENFEVFDFELDEEDLRKLDALDKGAEGRTFTFGSKTLPEYPFAEE